MDSVIVIPSGIPLERMTSFERSQQMNINNFSNSSDKHTDYQAENSVSNDLLELQKKLERNRKIALKTLTHSDLAIKFSFETVSELLQQFCMNTPFKPEDLLLLQNGKELSNDCVITKNDIYENPKTYLLIRPTATTIVQLTMKYDKSQIPISVPINQKVWQFKRDLYKNKLVMLRPEQQRIIIGAKVIADHNLIGDYLLKAFHQNSNSYSNNRDSGHNNCSEKDASNAISSGVNRKVNINKGLTIYLSPTTNTKHEVDITLKMKNKKELKFSIEINKPVSLIPPLLKKLFGIPLPTENNVEYIFCIKSPITNKDIELDMEKTLLDYGVTTNIKNLSMEMLFERKVSLKPITLLDIMFLHCLVHANNSVFTDKKIELPKLQPMSSMLPIILNSALMSDSDTEAEDVQVVTRAEKNEKINNGKVVENRSKGLFDGMKAGFLKNQNYSTSSISNKAVDNKKKFVNNEKSTMFTGLKRGFLSSSKGSNKKQAPSKKD